ncbi:MAG: transposase, partial [Anaerolineaceae bacterium]|nr:transposase [Anaerolineaceae bacterium]
EAYCILPDHIHLLMSLPEGVKNYSNLLREIKKTVTKSIREHRDQPNLVIWQARFWEHTIRSQRDMQTHYDYIHYNPVKHGYVNSVDQWQWSSIKDKSDKKEIEASIKNIEGLNKKGYSFVE